MQDWFCLRRPVRMWCVCIAGRYITFNGMLCMYIGQCTCSSSSNQQAAHTIICNDRLENRGRYLLFHSCEFQRSKSMSLQDKRNCDVVNTMCETMRRHSLSKFQANIVSVKTKTASFLIWPTENRETAAPGYTCPGVVVLMPNFS